MARKTFGARGSSRGVSAPEGEIIFFPLVTKARHNKSL